MLTDTNPAPLPLIRDRMVVRVAWCMLGLAFFGLGIRLFIAAELGLAPWDVLHQGLSSITGIGIGWWILMVGLALVAVSWALLGQRPGVGTILNAVEIGLVVALIGDRLPQFEALAPRLLMVAAGLISIGIGSGIYIGAGLGTGPRDGLMMGLAKRGTSIRVARTVIEATVLLIGLALGGSAGFGTVAFVVGIGPVVQWFMPRLALPSGPAGRN